MNVPKGVGSLVSMDFSQKLMHELVKISAKCMSKHYGEHPLQQSERCMYSALHAAANSITPVHFSELSVDRAMTLAGENNRARKIAKEAAKKMRGRVDLYCAWRNAHFFIELKQRYIGLTGNKSRLGT
jgi:hypothetical protein